MPFGFPPESMFTFTGIPTRRARKHIMIVSELQRVSFSLIYV
jgi:hypothetical protein